MAATNGPNPSLMVGQSVVGFEQGTERRSVVDGGYLQFMGNYIAAPGTGHVTVFGHLFAFGIGQKVYFLPRTRGWSEAKTKAER